MTLSIEQENQLMLSVKTHRNSRPLSPTEVAEYMTISGKTNHELAMLLGISSGMVGKLKNVGNLNIKLRHLVEWGKGEGFLGQSVAYEISKFQSSQMQIDFSEICIREHLKKAEVVAIRQRMSQMMEDLPTAADVVLHSRPRVITRYLIMGSIMDKSLVEKLKGKRQGEKDKIFRTCLAQELGDSTDWSGKLGNDIFTINCSQQDSDKLKSSPRGLELHLTRLISNAVD